MKKLIWLFLMFLYANGTNYYIATDGDDDNNGSIGSPWATIVHACSTVVAGDTAFLRNGTHNTTSTNIEFVNSGTSESAIVMKSYHGEFAFISGDSSDVLFNLSNNHISNYIHFDSLGFENFIRSAIRIGDSNGSTGIHVTNCIFRKYGYNDNTGAVQHKEYGYSTVIKNNTIRRGYVKMLSR